MNNIIIHIILYLHIIRVHYYTHSHETLGEGTIVSLSLTTTQTASLFEEGLYSGGGRGGGRGGREEWMKRGRD